MLKLLKSRTNTVPVGVESTVNIAGFRAVIDIDQIAQKTVTLSAVNPTVAFTASEVAKINEDGEYGLITIYDSSNEVHIKQRIFVMAVDRISDTYGFDKIHLVVVAKFDKSSGGSSSDWRTALAAETQARIQGDALKVNIAQGTDKANALVGTDGNGDITRFVTDLTGGSF